MGFRHLTVRQRVYHAVITASADPTHGHWTEYCVDLTYVITNIMFVVGSMCFFDWNDEATVRFGDWLFIIASVVNVVMAAYTVYESRSAKSIWYETLGDHERQELTETLLFLVASAIFAGGSICYMPGIYSTEKSETLGHEVGAWSFVTGSLGLVLSAYYNALGVTSSKPRGGIARIVYGVHTLAMAFTQAGSAFFMCGSFLYRPAFQNKCAPETADTASNMGTSLYVLGSLIYLLQSLMVLGAAMIKHDRVANERTPLAHPQGKHDYHDY